MLTLFPNEANIYDFTHIRRGRGADGTQVGRAEGTWILKKLVWKRRMRFLSILELPKNIP